MLDCLILGDSLAVGVGQVRPGCTVAAQVGITSGTFLQTLFPTVPKQAARVVISLGVNDDPGMATLDNLRRLRRGLGAGRVTWLLPGLKEGVRSQIRTVAAERGDQLVDTISQVGPDHLHPGRDGYRTIAAWTERGEPGPATPPRRYASGPMLIPMQAANPRPGALPQVQTPGAIYGAWPVTGPFAAIPPRDFAFRAFAGARGN